VTRPVAVRWDELEPETVFPGITRQVLQGDRQTLVRYLYEPGSVFPVHAHAEEQVTVVVSGTIEFEIGGDRITLGPGQVAVIPPNVPHGATVTCDVPVETFNSLSPRREQSPIGPVEVGRRDISG